jgi:hypothetical protein
VSICLACILAALASVVTADGAPDDVLELVVNSTEWGGQDSNLSDGKCNTQTDDALPPKCTLRAAIEQSNALKLPAGAVRISVSTDIPLGTSMTGVLDSTHRMTSQTASTRDNGALFWVTAPVVIDLGRRLNVTGDVSDNEWAAFYLNGDNITVQNADAVASGRTSFVVGPDAKGITIDGGEMGETDPRKRGIVDATINPERFVTIVQGAQNVTVKRYELKGFWSNSAAGLFTFQGRTGKAMSDIVIEDIVVDYKSPVQCSGDCRAPLTLFVSSPNIQGLTFRNMQVFGIQDRRAFRMTTGTPSIQDLKIIDSRFTDNNVTGSSRTDAFIALPNEGRLTGTTTIARNVITASGAGNTDVAIYADGNAGPNSTALSGITVEDNHFDGYANNGGAVALRETGVATVRRNTFGPKSGSQSDTVGEETGASTAGGRMVVNVDATANENINTWYPSTDAKVLTGSAPADALTVKGPESKNVCLAQVTVTAPTASPVPTEPVTLDFFWTGQRTAEKYLGSVSGVSGASQLVVFPFTVDPDSGQATGFVRVQTQARENLGQFESSQYSRVRKLTGDCRPVLTLARHPNQLEQTKVRFLKYRLTSSVPLDPATVEVSDFTVNVVRAARADKLTSAVHSVKAVDESSGLMFDVVVKVNDSARIKLELGQDLVATPGGLTNAAAASESKESPPVVEFTNPLSAKPGKLTAVLGDTDGQRYELVVADDAPELEASLEFTTTVQQGGGVTVEVSRGNPVIAKEERTCGAISVTAAGDTVESGAVAIITNTVTSGDPNYHGLLVPDVPVYLFETDPMLRIEKRAYYGMTAQDSVESIRSTGTLVGPGARLTDGVEVCFVYKATNISRSEWKTELTDVTITDSDTRLGDSGVIATGLTIGPGASVERFACTTLVPVDSGGGDPP